MIVPLHLHHLGFKEDVSLHLTVELTKVSLLLSKAHINQMIIVLAHHTRIKKTRYCNYSLKGDGGKVKQFLPGIVNPVQLLGKDRPVDASNYGIIL